MKDPVSKQLINVVVPEEESRGCPLPTTAVTRVHMYTAAYTHGEGRPERKLAGV